MNNNALIDFKGWNDKYALFAIGKGIIQNNQVLDKIVVCHQGNWASEDAMMCHPEYKKYEDVQVALGHGLKLLNKYYLPDKNRTCFEYLVNERDCVLAVPATGEEINFEVYGIDSNNIKTLLLQREL